MVEILLTHPDIKTNIENYKGKNPKDCIAGHVKKAIESEFLKVEAVAQKRKQTKCACAFLLYGVLAAGLCFTVYNPVPLAVTSLLFFAIGCGFLYRANTILNDVNSSQVSGCEHTVSVQVRCHSST